MRFRICFDLLLAILCSNCKVNQNFVVVTQSLHKIPDGFQCNPPYGVDDLVNPLKWYAEIVSESNLNDTIRSEELFEEYFPRIDVQLGQRENAFCYAGRRKTNGQLKSFILYLTNIELVKSQEPMP